MLRKDQHGITRESISWTTDGKRKTSRSKTTWRRTKDSKLKNSGGKSKGSDWVERMCGCFMCHLAWKGLSKLELCDVINKKVGD